MSNGVVEGIMLAAGGVLLVATIIDALAGNAGIHTLFGVVLSILFLSLAIPERNKRQG